MHDLDKGQTTIITPNYGTLSYSSKVFPLKGEHNRYVNGRKLRTMASKASLMKFTDVSEVTAVSVTRIISPLKHRLTSTKVHDTTIHRQPSSYSPL